MECSLPSLLFARLVSLRPCVPRCHANTGFVLEDRPDGPHVVLPNDASPAALQATVADALVLCEARDDAIALLSAHSASD
jgi:hypothetical protein